MTTPRDDLLKALRHQRPDWIPLTGHCDPYNQPGREAEQSADAEHLLKTGVCSHIACRHVPARAERAGAMAKQIIEALDETRLHWMADPDGMQLPPEIAYGGQCLGSEMGASFLAPYWRGRKDGLWS